MKRTKRLVESLEMAIVVAPNMDIITDNMIAEWGGVQLPQLSVMLVHLRYLAMIHQNHHWTTKGDPFYGDHLLYQRLYDKVNEEIDTVAEKAVGLGSAANVDLVLQTRQIMGLVQGYGMTSTLPQPSDLARRSYQAEMSFLKATSHIVEHINECGMMSRGLDNMIAGIEDTHESSVFLLKQRITQ